MNPRRSWMIVPAHDADQAMRNQDFEPDVAVLDLEYSVPPKSKETARSGLRALVNKLGNGQADIFVRIDRETRWADVRSAVYPGVKGVVFPGPEEPEEVVELGELIAAMEKERGLDPGATELVL